MSNHEHTIIARQDSSISQEKQIKEKYSARNPRTGELIYIPEKNKVRFRASKKLKDFINK